MLSANCYLQIDIFCQFFSYKGGCSIIFPINMNIIYKNILDEILHSALKNAMLNNFCE